MTTKVILKNVRFSYANVFEPKAFGDNEPKYSVSVLIPKDDAESLEKIKSAVGAEVQDFFRGKKPAGFHGFLRDGDVDRPDDPVYAGHMFFNASSKRKPIVLNEKKQEVNDENEFYSGCYGAVSVNVFGYSYNKIRHGVACGLNGLMKTRDGERLGGSASGVSDFSDIDIDGSEDF